MHRHRVERRLMEEDEPALTGPVVTLVGDWKNGAATFSVVKAQIGRRTFEFSCDTRGLLTYKAKGAMSAAAERALAAAAFEIKKRGTHVAAKNNSGGGRGLLGKAPLLRVVHSRD